jgi:anti-sigma regulatory factor (Ser/Thr protein kinase)
MIQRRAEEVFSSQWHRAGACTGFPSRNETGRTATAGRAAAARWQARLADSIGFGWLSLAAEMAGLVNGGWRPSARPPRIATRTIGADPGSVRAARDFTIATVCRWGAAERSHDIAIVVSELLTNALQHARPRRIRLGLLQHGPCVLCAVADPGRSVPVPRTPGLLAECGRGLQMVGALSDRWGYSTPGDTGKVVWAVFDPPLTGLIRPVLPDGPGARVPARDPRCSDRSGGHLSRAARSVPCAAPRAAAAGAGGRCGRTRGCAPPRASRLRCPP